MNEVIEIRSLGQSVNLLISNGNDRNWNDYTVLTVKRLISSKGDVTMHLLLVVIGCGVAMATAVNSVAIATANRTITINRHFDGDIFSLPGNHSNHRCFY